MVGFLVLSKAAVLLLCSNLLTWAPAGKALPAGGRPCCGRNEGGSTAFQERRKEFLSSLLAVIFECRPVFWSLIVIAEEVSLLGALSFWLVVLSL